MVWSSTQGLILEGSASLSIDVPLNRSLGGIEITMLSLGVETSDDRVVLFASVALTARLGPVMVNIQGVGIELGVITLEAQDRPGTFGDVDLALGFRPPDGAGLLVDAGPISGGGFLAYDPETGRYAGVLELEVYSVSVTAIGVLDTRLPEGQPGYSLLLIVSVEFQPVQLGFGFTLNGVGGLAGVNRRVATEALRSGLRAGSIDAVLFPENPLRDAARIVSDLQTIFPPAPDRHVFAPMAVIGWGTPTLIEGEMGIVLEFPYPLRPMLLGQFRVALPQAERPLVELNLDLVGELDLELGRLALDGGLRNSRVVGFTLEGELAMRLAWGGDPNFALAIGGFHPDFTPPAGFPKLKRLTIPIGADDNPRLTLEGYLAVTSNTLQIGAAASVYAEKGWFSIEGDVEFNALFIFIPFSFTTDFSGKVVLRSGGTVLAAISLEAILSGPAPWHASGEACLEIRFLPDVCVPFDFTVGSEERVLPPVLDPWPALQAALENTQNWSGTRPPGLFRAATLAAPAPPAGGPVLDPAGGIAVRETVVPLNRRLTKFGESPVDGGSVRFDLVSVTMAGQPVAGVPVRDYFAPAQFEDLNEDQRLSRPSFERMDSGASAAVAALAHGTAVGGPVEYETRIVDSAFTTRPGKSMCRPSTSSSRPSTRAQQCAPRYAVPARRSSLPRCRRRRSCRWTTSSSRSGQRSTSFPGSTSRRRHRRAQRWTRSRTTSLHTLPKPADWPS